MVADSSLPARVRSLFSLEYEVRSVHIDERKWPDLLHWQFDAHLLGEDEHGVWLHVPSHTIAKRGAEPARPIGVGFVSLVPVTSWWIVEFYVNHPFHEVYVNIGTPPKRVGDSITQVDLDLDVVRKPDGTVVVLDEDEFVENQVRYGYPEGLICDARAAADAAVDRLRQREEPFGTASVRWISSVDPLTLA
jgi:hypothetical protein